ncbi:CinA family protein [Mycoplasma sp. E35C]|uniref:CinA family protein n=1 Tax=Mycoplasma sp. E35C TaxID=2801918 RepID=UPI001CA397D2|nr:CinA family protein [Mycoplasma sp. E35C]QZX49350.1 CinA family protein [Mycoplasma sp. E35C]
MIDYKDIIANELNKHNLTIAVIESQSNGMIANALLVSKKLDDLFKGSIVFKNISSVNRFLLLNNYQAINDENNWNNKYQQHLSSAAHKYFGCDVLINFVHFNHQNNQEVSFHLMINQTSYEQTIDLSKVNNNDYVNVVSMMILNKLVELLVLMHEKQD